jgi:magnesium and cobalt transporter
LQGSRAGDRADETAVSIVACRTGCARRSVILASSLTAGTAPVSDPPSVRSARAGPGAHADRIPDKRSFLVRLVELISPGPDSKAELIRTLAEAESRELIEPESRLMLEGVLRMADLTAGDVMVPTLHMDLLDIAADYDALLAQVIDAAHSRFPVYEGARDNVIGILMAKDLLKLQRFPELKVRMLLRPAVFVPESKRLNELLRDFRSNRNHLAIVIDEFGNTAGLLTIEDVLEEIVGEIEDEFDEQEQENGIYTLADGSHRVAGDVAIGAVNEAFGTRLSEADFETIGGLVAQELGRVPRRGEAVELGGLRFTVMLTRGGAVRWFRVARLPGATAPADGGGVD